MFKLETFGGQGPVDTTHYFLCMEEVDSSTDGNKPWCLLMQLVHTSFILRITAKDECGSQGYNVDVPKYSVVSRVKHQPHQQSNTTATRPFDRSINYSLLQRRTSFINTDVLYSVS